MRLDESVQFNWTSGEAAPGIPADHFSVVWCGEVEAPATGEFRGDPLRLAGIHDFIFSSPVGAAGRIYVTGRDGATVVLRHDLENATLAVNQLNDSFSASPALSGGELYLRGEHFLYCIAEPARP